MILAETGMGNIRLLTILGMIVYEYMYDESNVGGLHVSC
jgi:hypothetical protein